MLSSPLDSLDGNQIWGDSSTRPGGPASEHALEWLARRRSKPDPQSATPWLRQPSIKAAIQSPGTPRADFAASASPEPAASLDSQLLSSTSLTAAGASLSSASFAAIVLNPWGLVDIGGVSDPCFADLDGDGDIDLLATENTGFAYFQNIAQPGSLQPLYAQPVTTSPFGLQRPSSSYSWSSLKISLGDLDGDGDLDALAGDANGYIYFYRNTGSASSPSFTLEGCQLQSTGSSAVRPGNALGLDLYALSGTAADPNGPGGMADPTLVDLDSDGDLDVVVGARNGSLYFFENQGGVSNPSFKAPIRNPFGIAVDTTPSNTSSDASWSSPAFVDIDGDGDLDLFKGDKLGYTTNIGTNVRTLVYYYENTGGPQAPQFAAPTINPFGIDAIYNSSYGGDGTTAYATPSFFDYDQDGDKDLIFGNNNGTFALQENNQFSAPKILSSSPGDGSLSASTSAIIQITFDEAIQRGSGTIELRSGSASGELVESFAVATSTAIGINGATLSIDPTANLLPSTQYFILLPAGCVKDLSGLSFAGSSSYDFTTSADSVPPQITGIAVEGTKVTLQFSEAVRISGSNALARFSASVNSVARSIIGLSPVVGDPSRLELTLSGAAPGSAEAVAISYSDPSSGNDSTDVVEDLATNDLGTLSNVADTLITGVDVSALAAAYTTLRLTGTAINGSGNASANTIIGNANVNVINGGLGNDTMNAGDDGDIYLITNSNERTIGEINDTGSSGTDELRFTSAIAGQTLRVDASDVGLERVVIGTGTTSAPATTTATTALNVNASLAPNGLTITGNNGANAITGTAFSDTIQGNSGNDNLNGGGGSDFITGGIGADSLTGGSGAVVDTFLFSPGHSGQTTNTDFITDFQKGAAGFGDVIDCSANLSIGGSAVAATSTQALINQTTGVATFASKSGGTLSDALGDIASRFTAATNSAGEFAFFKVGGAGNYYLFVSDGVSGVTSNDVVLQLAGITSLSGINLSGGNLTITG